MRLVFLAVLLLTTRAALAEWVTFEGGGSYVTHLDPATVEQEGNLRRIWVVVDLMDRDADGELSRKMLTEYDCRQSRHRLLAYSEHSEKRGGGRVLFIQPPATLPSAWERLRPDSSGALVAAIVCD